MTRTCQAPAGDVPAHAPLTARLCGRPATTSATVEGVTFDLCAACAQELTEATMAHSDMTVTLSLSNDHKALVCTSCLSAAPSYAEAARRARPDRRSTYTGVLRGATRLPRSVLRDCVRAERRAALLASPAIRALDSGDGLLERAVDEILAERPGATAQEIAEALRAAEVRS